MPRIGQEQGKLLKLAPMALFPKPTPLYCILSKGLTELRVQSPTKLYLIESETQFVQEYPLRDRFASILQKCGARQSQIFQLNVSRLILAYILLKPLHPI